MKAVLIAASVLAVSFGAALPALADSKEDANSCHDMELQIHRALNSATGDVEAARHEWREGQQSCTFHMYTSGLDHYRKAQTLLGVSASATPGGAAGAKAFN